MSPLESRCNLKRGPAATLILDIESSDDDGNAVVQGERMWVIVAEMLGEFYIGILDNRPSSLEPSDDVYLCLGAEIPFRTEHIIKIGKSS